jgi:hypothetical protein
LYNFWADFLTVQRLIIGLFFPFLSTWGEKEEVALFFVIYGWTTDILDGWLARKGDYKTKFGSYDFPIDMIFVWGSSLYFSLIGFLPLKIFLTYSAISLLFILKYPKKSVTMNFAFPLTTIPFIFALFKPSLWGEILFLWLITFLILDWHRFTEVVLEYIEEMEELFHITRFLPFLRELIKK